MKPASILFFIIDQGHASFPVYGERIFLGCTAGVGAVLLGEAPEEGIVQLCDLVCGTPDFLTASHEHMIHDWMRLVEWMPPTFL